MLTTIATVVLGFVQGAVINAAQAGGASSAQANKAYTAGSSEFWQKAKGWLGKFLGEGGGSVTVETDTAKSAWFKKYGVYLITLVVLVVGALLFFFIRTPRAIMKRGRRTASYKATGAAAKSGAKTAAKSSKKGLGKRPKPGTPAMKRYMAALRNRRKK
jgi:hypothetical protein